MAWNSYFSLGGGEVVNSERCAAYAHNAGANWFKDPIKSENLHDLLGQPAYRSPFQDDNAPWTDPEVPDSYRFYGVYPLEITGVDDSTRTSVVIENNGDGGNAGRLRHGTRQMVFTCLLAGDDDAAVDVGFGWLKQTLLAGQDRSCLTDNNLSFYSAEPPFEPGQTDCGDDYLRTIQRVTVNNGPTITEKHITNSGGVAWTVSFTATADIPFQVGLPVPIVEHFLDRTAGAPNVAGGNYDDHGHFFTEVPCPHRSFAPVFDPLCPDLVLPPIAPPIKLGCFTTPTNWERFGFDIPADTVRKWADMVPLMQITASAFVNLRNMRVRIYKDPDGSFDPDVHPCRFIADFWVTYLPQGNTMLIDGRDQTIFVDDGTRVRRGDGLVYDSNNMPFTWPSLSCGIGYKVTVDMTQQAGMRPPTMDFSLVPRFK